MVEEVIDAEKLLPGNSVPLPAEIVTVPLQTDPDSVAATVSCTPFNSSIPPIDTTGRSCVSLMVPSVLAASRLFM